MDDILRHQLDRIEEKLDKNTEFTIKNVVVLEEHQRRSEALEKQVALLAAEQEPLKRHVIVWSGFGKGLIALCGLLAAVAGVLRAFGIL